MKLKINHLHIIFIKNILRLVWSNGTAKILLVADILGLIISLFPEVVFPPLLFLAINFALLTGIVIHIFRKKEYRILSEPETILLEHTYYINALAISPDEKYIASCGGDNYAILWDRKEHGVLLRITHDSWVGNIAFSPDNQFLYTLAGKNGTISQYDMGTRKLIFKKTWHTDNTRGLAISLSGKRAVISCKDGTFTFFDPTEKNSYCMPIKITDGELRKVCISKDDIIATGSDKGEIFLIDLREPGKKHVEKIYEDIKKEMIQNVAFNSKGTLLAFTDSGGYLKIINLLTQDLIPVKAHNGHAIAIAFSPNDNFIATGGQDGNICIWDLEKDHLVKSIEIRCHQDDVTALVFSQDMRLYSASRDSKILEWNLNGLY